MTLTTTTSGNVTVETITALGDLVTITSAGSIEEIGGGDPGSDILALSARLTAVGGIGSGNALETTITNLAFSNATSGNVQIANTGACADCGHGVAGLTTSNNTGWQCRSLGD